MDVVTNFDSYDKRTVQVTGQIIGQEDLGPVRGYEIHMGMTERGGSLPLFDIEDLAGKHTDGAVSVDGMVMGSYLHGSFDLPAFRRFFLSKACHDRSGMNGMPAVKEYDASVEESIERIASALQDSLDMDKVFNMLGMEVRK